MDILKFIILTQIKSVASNQSALNQRDDQTSGFTLIELLAAIVLAVLVITPLLGIAVHLLNTDRQEQAKATSEQELQLAADYITRDLQQAIYIYDADGLENNTNTVQSNSGINNQVPPLADAPGCQDDNNCIPVLAFWKRRLFSQALPINNSINCLTANDNNQAQFCNDSFVYALVVYYLIEDNNNTWSNAARIARFEISDGLIDPFTTNPNDPYLPQNESKKRIDAGFQLFELEAGERVENAMNTWTKATGNYTESAKVLVDYIDNSTQDADNNQDIPREDCPPTADGWSQSPSNNNHPFSFYACVNSEQNIARVFIRGNAWARFKNNNFQYRESQSSYFPTVRTEVKALGKLVQ